MSNALGEVKMRRVELVDDPVTVARELRHLPGLVFFDSAGNFPQKSEPALSLIAAKPVKFLRGNVAEDLVNLEAELAHWEVAVGGDMPCGAACGWVDYESDFCFGIFPEVMVFDHESGQWWETGDLSKCRRGGENEVGLHLGKWEDSLGRAGFLRAVETAQDYIASGDIYQVNLSRHLQADCASGGNLFSLYERLRAHSPAPWGAYFSMEGREILSSSPELFLKMKGHAIETRPIKGTRPRFAEKEADEKSAAELQASEKEAAELVMITDLERNDLGQVCEFGSVEATELLALEKLAQVFHLVSTVKGRLREEVSHLSALAACFPGGSITGAPKKRACEIISELEPVKRGLYTGTMGYFGFNGVSQFNIAIRTLVREAGVLSYGVGAGIVADSKAEAEFEETEQKALGIKLALEDLGQDNLK